jgi:hypothetical protein
MMKSRKIQSITRKKWFPLLIYTLLTLGMTYPAIINLSNQVLGNSRDTWIFWWNNWWVKRALTAGGNVYYTKHLFFPQGVELTYHSFSWLNTALWLILEPLTGDIAAYNITVLWVFPLAGWGMECLVREMTGSRNAAFIAGLIYAFIPYRFSQYNHPHLMGTQWIPFYTLFFLRAIREGHWQDTSLATLFLVLTALVGWNLFIYSAIWTAWLAVFVWLQGQARVRQSLSVSLIIFLISGVILSPLLVPMLAGRFGRVDTLGNVPKGIEQQQTDLIMYLLPSNIHPLWGEGIDTLYDHLVKPNEPRRPVYLGYTVMALVGYGLLRKGVRKRRLWWVSIAFWWIMALGAFLKFKGKTYYSIPLPYYPLSRLYVFKLLKMPDRYNLMLSLPLAVIVGYATKDLFGRLGKSLRATALVIISSLILFEYLGVPLEMQTPKIRSFYRQIAQEQGEFGIVELPIDFHRTAKKYMLYQTVHGHPIVEGHVSRRPAAATTFMESHPLLRSLYQTHEMDLNLTDVSRQLRHLRDVGFRYVIIHKQFIDRAHVTRWRNYLTMKPRHEDDDLVVFPPPPTPGMTSA